MDRVYFFKKNKYIRLKIHRPAMSFRASIAIHKHGWNESTNRYYEVNYETFHPYDFKDEEDALQKAKEWLENELNEFQKVLIEEGKQ